ncbi:hypothetical protein ACO0SA_002829 [Hanseniaspora valbyensis]
MNENKVILKLEKTRISNTAVYLMYNANLPKETTMKRVDDGWINISQCFKLENFTSSKIKRHKILEDEELAGTIKIEKITGGWGRFQGSWISTDDAIYLFKKYSFQNYVNLTLLSFKEDPNNVLPFKQDVKHYEPVTFEFEAKSSDLAKYKKNKTDNKNEKANNIFIYHNGNQQETDFKNINQKEFQPAEETKKKKKNKTENTPKTRGIKRLSLHQLSAVRQDCKGYEEIQKTEDQITVSGDIDSSPYKRLKSSNVKANGFATESFGSENSPIYSKTNNTTITPFNSFRVRKKGELSTFKNQTVNNNSWESRARNNTNNEYTPSKEESKFNQAQDDISPLLTKKRINTPSIKKTRLSAEKYKNLIINTLESDQNNDEIMNVLYECKFPKNIDPNFTIDEEGNTALHWAAAQGNVSLAKYLINELKSDPFHCNTKGMNCLSKALFFDNNFKNNIFSGLLTLLANCLVVQDMNGKLPLHYIIELCSSKVKNINVSLHYLDLIIKFLSIEFDVPYSRDEKTGQLNYSKRSFIKMALNCQDLAGNTPLHLAAINANFDIYNYFITIGGDPVILNNLNQSPYTILQKHYNDIVQRYNPKLKDPVELQTSNGTDLKNEFKNYKYETEQKQTNGQTNYNVESSSSSINKNNIKKEHPILKLEKDNSSMMIEPIEFGLPNNSNSTSPTTKSKAMSNSNKKFHTHANNIANNNIFGISRSQSSILNQDTSMNQKLLPNMPLINSSEMKKGKSLPPNSTSSLNFNSSQQTIPSESAKKMMTFSQSKASKLAPLNLSKLNSSQTILKRSPNPNILFLSRNNLKNHDMVQVLRKCNSKMNELFVNLNEIYATREEKLLNLESLLNDLKVQIHRFTAMDNFYKTEDIYKVPEELLAYNKKMDKNFSNIIRQWKLIIQKSQKTQLILKSAMSMESDKTENNEAMKLLKLNQILQLEKKRNGLITNMDTVILHDSGDILKDKYIKVLSKIVKQDEIKK